jgi:hypothetical protein
MAGSYMLATHLHVVPNSEMTEAILPRPRVDEEESVNRSQLDIKRKTCDIRI